MKKITLLICVLAYMLMGTLSVNAQWKPTNGPAYGGIVSCIGIQGTNIFAGMPDDKGFGASVFLSTDGGANWVLDNVYALEPPALSFYVIGNDIYAGGFSIFLSSDTGRSWAAAVDSGLPRDDYNALLMSGSNFFAAGYYDGVFLSTDTAKSWKAINNGLATANVVSLARIGTNIFAGTANLGIFLSTDTGASWIAIDSGLPKSMYYNTYPIINSLAVIGTNIFMGTNWEGVFLSTDSGANWIAVNNGLTSLGVLTLFTSGTNIFAGTQGGGVCLSTNNGENWTAINNGLSNSDVYSLALSGTTLYAGTDSIVWKRSLSNILTSIENMKADNNITIYPNPATNQLTIQAPSILHSATVSIINILGQEASPRPPLQMERGDAVIEVSKLPAGMYLLRMKWEGGSVVRRFVKE